MIAVTLKIRKSFVEGFLERMTTHGISQNALAREMDKEPSQVSRWFTGNPERQVRPTLETAVEMERALAKMIRRQAQRRRRAARVSA